jgi:PRC-barrel domain
MGTPARRRSLRRSLGYTLAIGAFMAVGAAPLSISGAAAQTVKPQQPASGAAADNAAPGMKDADPKVAAQQDVGVSGVVKECQQRIGRIEKTIAERRDRYSVMPPQDVHSLRQAALAFARAGDSEGCEAIADRMEEFMETRREEWTEQQAADRIKEARPFWSVLPDLKASEIIGAEVMSGPDEEIGEVSDVIFAENGKEYLLLERGGFLGLGEDLIPVPVERMRVTKDGLTLVMDTGSTELLDRAPTLDELQETAREDWPEKVEAWWANEPVNEPATAPSPSSGR